MYPLDKMKIVVNNFLKITTILLFGGKSDIELLDTLKVNQNVCSSSWKTEFF